MLPNYLSIKVESDKTFDGKQSFKAVVAIDRETFAFRGDSFSDCYSHALRSVEEVIKCKTQGAA